MVEMAEIREVAQKIGRQANAKSVILFGSYARGQATEYSDVDILVQFKKNVGLLEFIGLKIRLEEALGRKVDLVEYESIKPALKKAIRAQEVRLI